MNSKDNVRDTMTMAGKCLEIEDTELHGVYWVSWWISQRHPPVIEWLDYWYNRVWGQMIEKANLVPAPRTANK